MATLIATADGNLTGSTTFAAAEAGALAAVLNRNTTTTFAAAAAATSVTFTVTNAKIIDGAVLWLKATAASPTGTFKVDLQKGGVSQATVTVNKTDLPDSTNANPCPVFFKFTGTATGDGGANWTLVVTTTGTGTITVNTASATTTNYSRAIRTTTTQTPAAADDLYVVGELTGAGTKNTRTVTMDSTAATVYGNGAVNSTTVNGGGIHISNWGTLTYGTTASTAYILRIAGDMIVYQYGALNIVSPQTSTTQVLEFQPVSADGDFGLRILDNAVVNITGQPRTAGKLVTQCKLTSNLAAAGTTCNVNVDTGWLSGDQVCIASTTRTVADCELKALSGNAGASSFTIAAATVAHSGTAPTQAEIGNITRNVKIRSTSTTLMSYVYCTALSTVTATWAEFYYIGAGANNKRGVDIDGGAVANPKSFTYCSIHDCEQFGFVAAYSGTVASLNLTFSNNVAWIASNNGFFAIGGIITNRNWTVDSNLVMRTGNSYAFSLYDVGGVFTNNTAVGGITAGGYFLGGGSVIGTFDSNTAHSNGSVGLNLNQGVNLSGIISNMKVWKHPNNVGIVYTAGIATNTYNLVFTDPFLFDNEFNNFSITNGDTLTIRGGSISGANTATGIAITASNFRNLILTNVDMSGTGTGLAPHVTSDISITSTAVLSGYVNNCDLGAPTGIVATKTNWSSNSFVSFQRYSRTNGDHRTEMKYGALKTDSSVFNTASPSTRMTPNNASNRLTSATANRGTQVAVASGDTVTASVWVRKDATYFGSQPRLSVRANAAIGTNSDTVLTTASDVVTLQTATFDAAPTADIAMSNGNLTVTRTTGSNNLGVLSTTARNTGKYYFEITAQTSTSTSNSAGVCPPGTPMSSAGLVSAMVNIGGTANIIINGVSSGRNLGGCLVGDIYGYAYDLTAGLFWIRRNNGIWNNDAAANPATGVGGLTYTTVPVVPYVRFQAGNIADAVTANFGASTFNGTVPSGFNAGWGVPNGPGTATWVELTSTTAAATDDGVMEFIVDCDGTTGFVNVDDWSFA